MNYHVWRMEAAAVAPLVLVARNDHGDVEGILPLGASSRRRGPFSWRTLQTMGPRRLDFVDVIASPSRSREVLESITDWLARNWSRWDEFHLGPLREDAVLMTQLRELALPRGLELAIDAVSENLAIVIPRGARGWEDVCRRETRRSTVRILERLEASGFETSRVSEGHPVDAAVDALVSVHARRRAEFGQASLLVAADRKLLCLLVDDAIRAGGELMVMHYEGLPIAAQLTLRLDERVSHYRVAFHSAYRRWSPGIGLLVAALDRAIKSGAREYDFGLGVEEYKRRWSNLRRNVYTVRLSNSHPGRIARRLWSVSARSYHDVRRWWTAPGV